jgi:hypothetical protein
MGLWCRATATAPGVLREQRKRGTMYRVRGDCEGKKKTKEKGGGEREEREGKK